MIEDPNAIMKRQVISYWQSDPLNRPVKLTSILREPMFWTDGYITCYKHVMGRTLPEVERLLGLRPAELNPGAYLYEFMRLPLLSEFELRGYTQCPGGEPWTAAGDYPVGAGVPQWQVKRDSYIPSRLAAVIALGDTVR